MSGPVRPSATVSILSGPWGHVLSDLKRVNLVAAAIQNASAENGHQYSLTVIDTGIHKDYEIKDYLVKFTAHAFNVRPKDIMIKSSDTPNSKLYTAAFPAKKVR